MKSATYVSFLLLVTLLLVLAACGKGAATPSASNPDQAYTQIWETVAAGQTQTAAVVSPTPAASQTPEASVTPKATNTSLVSPTTSGEATVATLDGPAATNTKARPTTQSSCDNSQYVSDVTYTDGSEVSAGQSFVKTWRIKNTGSCEWNEDYMLAFGWGGEGTDWKSADPTHFSKVVKVGETIDVSIELVAPDEAGSYGGIFRTRNADDVYFGPTLTAYIVVK